jgi:hypothetical protein
MPGECGFFVTDCFWRDQGETGAGEGIEIVGDVSELTLVPPDVGPESCASTS